MGIEGSSVLSCFHENTKLWTVLFRVRFTKTLTMKIASGLPSQVLPAMLKATSIVNAHAAHQSNLYQYCLSNFGYLMDCTGYRGQVSLRTADKSLITQ